MPRICKHCGHLLADDELICKQCGTLVSDDDTEEEFNWDEADIDFSGEAEVLPQADEEPAGETAEEAGSEGTEPLSEAADLPQEEPEEAEPDVISDIPEEEAPGTEDTQGSGDEDSYDDDDDDYDDYDEEAEEERAAEEAELQRKKSNRGTLIGVSIFAILLIGIFVGFLCVTNYRNSPKRAAGTYNIYTIDGYTPDTLNEYYELDLSEDDMIIVLNKDYTGTLTIEDEEESLTWTLDKESNTLTMIIEETSYISATYYTNGYLEMTVSSSTYIMKKNSN